MFIMKVVVVSSPKRLFDTISMDDETSEVGFNIDLDSGLAPAYGLPYARSKLWPLGDSRIMRLEVPDTFFRCLLPT
jgi:hypothetical protein